MSTICQLHADLRYYLCMQPVDMRKQFQGLQGIINAEFGRYITQDEAFIFIGKTGTTVNGGGAVRELNYSSTRIAYLTSASYRGYE